MTKCIQRSGQGLGDGPIHFRISAFLPAIAVMAAEAGRILRRKAQISGNSFIELAGAKVYLLDEIRLASANYHKNASSFLDTEESDRLSPVRFPPELHLVATE
jgi:hypothetical protein